MTHTTISQVEGTAETVTLMLQERGFQGKVLRDDRNIVAVDDSHPTYYKRLMTGSKSEQWDFLHAMINTLWLLRPPWTEEAK